jgi:preprotein translocase subunit SecE
MKITNLPGKIITFFKEVKLEIKKVNWPTRQETVKYTLIVIGASLVIAAFLGGLDYALQTLLNKFIVNRFVP